MTDAASPVRIDARTVCAELGITLDTLKAMSLRGDYPELLRVTRGAYRVLRSEHEAWLTSSGIRHQKAASRLTARLAVEMADQATACPGQRGRRRGRGSSARFAPARNAP